MPRLRFLAPPAPSARFPPRPSPPSPAARRSASSVSISTALLISSFLSRSFGTTRRPVPLSSTSFAHRQRNSSRPSIRRSSQALVAAPVSVSITVVEPGFGTSNALIFTINPPLSPAGSLLPVGTVGLPYTAPLLKGGGTGPYAGHVPGRRNGPRRTVATATSTGAALTGTPTTAGAYTLCRGHHRFLGQPDPTQLILACIVCQCPAHLDIARRVPARVRRA